MENILKLAKTGVNKFFAFTRADGLHLALSFLLGRVVLFNCLSPFALAFLSGYIASNPDNLVRATIIGGVAIFGAFSTGMGIGLIKYILAFILFGLVYTAITTIWEKETPIISAVISAIVLLVSGLIYMGQWGITLYSGIMLFLECIICFSVSIFCSQALNTKEQTFQGVVSLCALGALTVIGFGDLTIGYVNFGKVIAGVYIMTIAFCGGAGAGAFGGIGIGFLYSFATYPLTDSIGIFSICGMMCGIMAKYKRAGVISGYIMASLLLYVYLGGSSGSMLTIFDTLSSVIIFCLVPKGFLLIAQDTIRNTLPKNRDVKKAVAELYDKLINLSQKAKEIAKETAFKPKDNKKDIATIFDKAASKVCKGCGLKFVCWDKEFNLTYDQLMHHFPVLKREGIVENKNVSPEFKQKCIHWEQFFGEVNKLFAQFNLNNLWVKKVDAGKSLVSQHMLGMSEILEEFAKETRNSLDFIPNPDNLLYLAIKKYGIKCYNTSVIKTQSGQHQVWVKVQGCNENVIADITTETLGRRFYIKETKTDGKKITVHLLEREKFSVITGVAARTKDGSRQSGDSYCQKKLEHNRHIAILSDGMGSGENARLQSLYAVNVMLRLLSCGFNKECAIKIMNLSLFLRQTKESFATMDATVIDLFEGNAEFIKIGASTSYIKRGNAVKKITSDSLPAGMITKISPYTTTTDIKKDDIIVLASDGVGGTDDKWLVKLLTDTKEVSPQKLSEKIIKEAVVRNDHTAKDDMTVIALQINEEIA